MISLLTGTLLTRELDHVELLTDGGTGYTVAIPLGTYESLPREQERVTLHTHLVVKEDGWQLFGFATAHERRVFQRLLVAKGFGPQLALNMLSALTAERLVRAIREKDAATLQGIRGLGKKKADQLILDLADKLDDLQLGGGASLAGAGPRGAGAEDAVRALVQLGYSMGEAEQAVRAALDAGAGSEGTAALIRAALGRVGGR
ncbi:MAG: Holliday junction branch migration protein RuvA [Gemmatimonadaceae bacterium]|jgi:Holliday junction DNA helicase RuvA|nr:Holliday junction branch migration protein RuvA [Gemmatimonadaceae bacterium]